MKMSKDKRDQFLFSAAEQGTDPALGKWSVHVGGGAIRLHCLILQPIRLL